MLRRGVSAIGERDITNREQEDLRVISGQNAGPRPRMGSSVYSLVQALFAVNSMLPAVADST